MSTWPSLTKGTGKTVSLDSSSSEQGTSSKPGPAASGAMIPAETVTAGSSSEQEAPDPPAAGIVVPSTSDEPIPKKRRVVFWEEHEGFGLCKGSNQLPCCFGSAGKPANAAPSGRCDLCDADVLKAFHDGPQMRITHLLANLEKKPLLHALARIRLVLGNEARDDYINRRKRTLQRRNPDRPKRGPRHAGEDRGTS